MATSRTKGSPWCLSIPKPRADISWKQIVMLACVCGHTHWTCTMRWLDCKKHWCSKWPAAVLTGIWYRAFRHAFPCLSFLTAPKADSGRRNWRLSCLSFLTARWRINIRCSCLSFLTAPCRSLAKQPVVSVFFWRYDRPRLFGRCS